MAHTTVLEKFKIKAPADLVSGEHPRPGLQTVAFRPCPHMTERERRSLVSLFTKTLILSEQGLTLMTLFNLNYSLNSSTAALKVRALVYEFGGLEGNK